MMSAGKNTSAVNDANACTLRYDLLDYNFNFPCEGGIWILGAGCDGKDIVDDLITLSIQDNEIYYDTDNDGDFEYVFTPGTGLQKLECGGAERNLLTEPTHFTQNDSRYEDGEDSAMLSRFGIEGVSSGYGPIFNDPPNGGVLGCAARICSPDFQSALAQVLGKSEK